MPPASPILSSYSSGLTLSTPFSERFAREAHPISLAVVQSYSLLPLITTRHGLLSPSPYQILINFLCLSSSTPSSLRWRYTVRPGNALAFLLQLKACSGKLSAFLPRSFHAVRSFATFLCIVCTIISPSGSPCCPCCRLCNPRYGENSTFPKRSMYHIGGGHKVPVRTHS